VSHGSQYKAETEPNEEDVVTSADPATRPTLTINIRIDNVPYKVHERFLTGAQLLALADLPSGDQLFREVPGPGDDEPVPPGKLVELHDGDKFYAVPVGNFG
jgi:Multiubiquitin